MTDEVLFKLPDNPQEFGVALEPSQLRRINFSALSFDELQRAGIEYIKTYFPNEFNDFVASNGVIMLLELVSYIGDVLAKREDILVDEAFLPTAQTLESVNQHLELINNAVRRATPAVVDIESSLRIPVVTEVRIPPGLRFELAGPDGESLTYEMFRSPTDFESAISIPPGKRGVVGFGIEGTFAEPFVVTSPGGPGQFIDIVEDDVLNEPITIDVETGGVNVRWNRIGILEKAGPDDEVYEVNFLDDRARIRFGDDEAGKTPLAGQSISVRFRTGGGTRGRIGSAFINESRFISPEAPASAAVEVIFRNESPSSGGEDAETLEQAKKRAPREFATQENAVTGEDYGLLASTFSHPVFGSVVKALGVIKTGVEGNEEAIVAAIQSATSVESGVEILNANFVNRNIVELYVLAAGVDGPVAPSSGLKQGLETFFTEINVLTDEVQALDGSIKAVDVEATIVISRSADAGTVKEQVNTVIAQFFNIENFDMGEGLGLSSLYEDIQSVPGVKSVNIFQPADNILPTKRLGDPTNPGVGFNELIVLGNTDLSYFLEIGSFERTNPA